MNETEVRATLIHEDSGKIVFHSTGKGKVWMRHFPVQVNTPVVTVLVDGVWHTIRANCFCSAWIGTARKIWHALVGMGWVREGI